MYGGGGNWTQKDFQFSLNLARDILAIPISTVTSESAFSTGGRVLDSFRSSLTPKIMEALIFTSDWLRQCSNPVSVEEAIEELENFEKGIKFDILNHFLLYFINFSIITNTFF